MVISSLVMLFCSVEPLRRSGGALVLPAHSSLILRRHRQALRYDGRENNVASDSLKNTQDRCVTAPGVILLATTKNKRRREVPLNSRADAVLARCGPKNSGLVFGAKDWDHFRAAWENAVERAKLSDFHYHDLRHTFASRAVQDGATLQELKDLLGHRSLAMVLRYSHLSPEHFGALLPASTPSSPLRLPPAIQRIRGSLADLALSCGRLHPVARREGQPR